MQTLNNDYSSPIYCPPESEDGRDNVRMDKTKTGDWVSLMKEYEIFNENSSILVLLPL